MKSKSKIEKQALKKTNSVLVETIRLAKKNKAWLEVAGLISAPRSKQKNINLNEVNKEDGEVIVVPGKVLSQGEINKKMRVVALGFSENAKEKLEKSKTEYCLIIDEVKNNPEAKGVKILK